MSLRRRHSFHNAYINLTPLIDMAMMLVVFFVLCLTTSQAAVRQVPVSLPVAGAADAPDRPDLDVVIDAAGGVSVAGQAVGLTDLPALAHGHARASLLADRDAHHGRVVDVVESLRRAGITEIYYATAKPLQDW